MAAEGAREPDAIDVIDAEPLHEQRHAGIQRRLRQLNRAHVGLGDLHFDRGALMQQIGERPAVRRDTRRAHRQSAVEHSVLVDDARQIHLGDDLDDPRAADAGDAGGGGGRRETGLVGPEVGADHLEARLEGLAVDADAFDRAWCRALAAADLGALECRTRRAGAGDQPPAVAEHDFGIRADIHEQRHLLGEIRALGEHHSRGVRAHMTRDAGQHVNSCVAMQFEVDDIRPQRERMVDGQRERRAAEFHRIDAEQQMMHDRVADHGRFEDVFVRDARLARDVGREPAQRLAHRRRHQRGAARVHHRIGHAAHQILAEADLRIHDARRGDHIAAAQVAEVRGNRGRAHIDRKSVDELVQAGPHRDDLLGGVHRHRDLPRAGAQRGLQRLQHR